MISIPQEEIVPIEQLRIDNKNPNRMTKAQREALEKNIQRYGFIIPIITNQDSVIADGQHRWEAAKSLGMTEVKIIRLPISEVDRRILRQVLNKLHGEHSWIMDIEEYKYIFDEHNQELLRDLLALQASEYQRIVDAVEALEPDEPEDFDMEKAIKEIAEPISKPGTIWQLGAHRLICGDSTKQETYDQLLQEEKADLIFTDPPYNLSFNSTVKGRFDVLENDNLEEQDYAEFIASVLALANSKTTPNTSIYCCIDYRNDHIIKQELKAHWEHKNTIVWAKDFGGLGSHYRFRHEFILYGTKGEPIFTQPGIEEDVWELQLSQEQTVTLSQQGFYIKTPKGKFLKISKHREPAKRSKIIHYTGAILFSTVSDEGTDVWRISSMNSFTGRQADDNIGFQHPTIKPVELCERAIKNSSIDNGIVLDMFAGSGSTLMACERTGRICRAIELDPTYCDVIVKRWEKFTKKEAKQL